MALAVASARASLMRCSPTSQPGVQGVDRRYCVLLAHLTSGLGAQPACGALDLVELGDQHHRVADDLATAPFMHLEQLAPGVRHAQRRGDTLFGQRVIAREIIADQGAREILQHAPGIFATAPKGEVEQHRALGYEVSGAVHPHVRPLGLSPARRQQLHRRLVGVDHAVAKEHGETLGAR